MAGFSVERAATLGPAVGAVGGVGGVVEGAWVRRAVVEGHDDVRAELMLDVDGELRREKVRGAVDVGLEGDAVVGDLAQVAEAEHLKAAGVGEHRAIPRDKTYAARPPAPPATRRGVGRGGTCCRGSSGSRDRRKARPATFAFTVPCVPTGMKAGVWNWRPEARVRVPARAREVESEAVMEKLRGMGNV